MMKYRVILFFILLIGYTQVWAQTNIVGQYDHFHNIYIPIDTNISAEPFSNGIAKYIVKRLTPHGEDSTFSGQSCGVLDTAGRIIIPAKYDYLSLTNDGYVIGTFNNRTEVRSLADSVIIPNKYSWIYPTQNHQYIVSTHNGYGVITTKDEIVIPIRYALIMEFGKGYVVESDTVRMLLDLKGKMIGKTKESGLPEPPFWNMADAGFMVFNQKADKYIHYKNIREFFLADRIIAYNRDNKWGLLDTLGSERTAPLYDQVRLYYFVSDSIGSAKNLIGAKIGNKWGVINNYGVKYLKFEYDSLYEWRGIIIVRRGPKYGFLKKDHRSTTSIKYDEVYALNRNKNNQIDRIIPVRIAGKWGFIDEQARKVTPLKYDSFDFYSPNAIKVTINSKVGLLNKLGQEIYPCIYKNITYIDGKIIVEKF